MIQIFLLISRLLITEASGESYPLPAGAGHGGSCAAHPGPRASHAIASGGELDRPVLVGGAAEIGGGMWRWDGRCWTRSILPEPVDGRGHFALAWDAGAGKLMLHGGLRLGAEGRFGDLWAWEGGKWALVHESDTGPGIRDHHGMAYDSARERMILFGGSRGGPEAQVLLEDTWSFDGETWRQHHGSGPPARATHRMAYDSRRNRLVLFGGWGDNGPMRDTWEWDGEGWIEAAGNGPTPRFATRIAFDEARGKTVLFGGRGPDGDLGDTWEWDGQTWIAVATTGPAPRNGHAMAYDRESGRIILHGGLSGGERLADTWAWDGSRWVLLASARTGAGPAAGPEDVRR